MLLEDFRVGKKFWSQTGCEYLCTDVGTRCVVAIEVDPHLDSGWYEGPPYRLPEVVFDKSEVEQFRARLRPVTKKQAPVGEKKEAA